MRALSKQLNEFERGADPATVYRQDWEIYKPCLEHSKPQVRANALICMIHQTNYLLDQQIVSLEKSFVQGGGYSEQLATARLQHRNKKQDRSDRSDQTDRTDPIPPCPLCGSPMVLRTARKGANEGSGFWGCSAYPDCRGTLRL